MPEAKKLNLELYKKLFLIRRSEEKIIRYYPENEMKTPMHMSMGSEAIAVGVCQALDKRDQVLGTYRSHALYLAKSQDIHGFFAEMYGRETALSRGRGGSMHLCAPGAGFLGTSAIVASNIPVAVGAAFANKANKNGKMVAVFFGDGALEEGVFWESLNVACVMKLPVLFVCEDNGLAVHTHEYKRHGYKAISAVVSKFNCHVFKENTTDSEVIYKAAKHAIALTRSTQRPAFLHFKYYRYLEHVGIYEDFEAGYRRREEFKKWLKIDPVNLQRQKLLRIGFPEDRIRDIESQIERRIELIIMKTKGAAFAHPRELYQD